MVIHKATLTVIDRQDIRVPLGSRPLCVQVQRRNICLWYECDPTKPEAEQTIVMTGTGHMIPDGLHYIGTVQDGDFVWHVYAA